MWMIFVLWGALTLGNAYWFFKRAERRKMPMRWKVGLGAVGGALNMIVFLNLNKFVDGHMPRWFYKIVIRNELQAISMVMVGSAVIVFLIGLIFIWKRAEDRPNPFDKS